MNPRSRPGTPLPRLCLLTPPVDDPAAVAGLADAMSGADVAAVLLRLPDADERSLINLVKKVAPAVQDRDAALLLAGRDDIVARSGADGAHLGNVDALKDAVARLKPKNIAGVGGLRTRHDAMTAGEAGADYVMFGDLDEAGNRASFDAIIDRVAWWAAVFEVPCVAYAARLEEIEALAAAGADFVAIGGAVFDDPRGLKTALAEAAKLGHPAAAYDLGLLYLEGQQFPQDFGRAAELFRSASQAGSPEAQYALATLYKDGRGVEKNEAEAARLLAAAALAENPDAEVEYAIALYNGTGVTKDEARATALFRRAALRGSPIAQNRLARIFTIGRGAAANPVEAIKWHLIAKAGGNSDPYLDKYVADQPAEVREAGQKAARPWLGVLPPKS